MEAYKREFIQFLEGAGVLKFGDFTAKSGRKIPYFVNAGMIKTGDQITKMGEFYAKAYADKLGDKKSVLYGPAYKGISLSISAAVALSKNGLDLPFFFNRKEVKDHGEGGTFVGYVPTPGEEVVMHYAETAKNAGLDGIVCSPLEAGKVHDRCGKNFLTITPGVRFADGDVGDQKRVMTPAAAKEIGSDYIVVGRPITAAADPVAAYERCVAEFCD